MTKQKPSTPRGFLKPTWDEVKTVCIEGCESLSRRLYIPTDFLLRFAELNEKTTPYSHSVEILVWDILEHYGINPAKPFAANPRPKGTLWEQDIQHGTKETKAIRREELDEEAPLSEIVGALATKLSLRTGAGKIALKYAVECVQLLDRKQQDYGAGNISATGIPGVLVRMNDKLHRLTNLISKGENPQNEATEDSWKDFTNYGLIGLMLHRDVWPTEAKK